MPVHHGKLEGLGSPPLEFAWKGGWGVSWAFPHSAVVTARGGNEWRPLPGKLTADKVNTAQSVKGRRQQKPVSLRMR